MSQPPSAVPAPPPPRIAPLEPPYEPDVAETLAKWMPPGGGVEPLRLFRTLVVHEQLSQRMRGVGAAILGRSALIAPQLREVMIDRTCALAGAEYEWGVHATAFGQAVGLTEEQLLTTVTGDPADACWTPEQALVMRLADELHTTSTVSDELWQALAERFSAAETLELIATAGWYHLISYICNGARVQCEEWAARFPD